MLDHLVWVADDLREASAQFQSLTGIEPAYGGSHGSGGTHNALVSLGPSCYLEIVAPQPGVTSGSPWIAAALARPEPHLLAYCMRSADGLEAVAGRAETAGIQCFGPSPGSRTGADGVETRWRLLIPVVPKSGGAVPFLIDWAGSRHPAETASRGASLNRFTVRHPDAARLNSAMATLGIGMPVGEGAMPLLEAELDTPKGRVVLRN